MDPKILNVHYYKKALLLSGDTKGYKDNLKILGGRWNFKLKGWIFKKDRKDKLDQFLNSIQSQSVIINHNYNTIVKPTIKKKKEKPKYTTIKARVNTINQYINNDELSKDKLKKKIRDLVKQCLKNQGPLANCDSNELKDKIDEIVNSLQSNTKTNIDVSKTSKTKKKSKKKPKYTTIKARVVEILNTLKLDDASKQNDLKKKIRKLVKECLNKNGSKTNCDSSDLKHEIKVIIDNNNKIHSKHESIDIDNKQILTKPLEKWFTLFNEYYLENNKSKNSNVQTFSIFCRDFIGMKKENIKTVQDLLNLDINEFREIIKYGNQRFIKYYGNTRKQNYSEKLEKFFIESKSDYMTMMSMKKEKNSKRSKIKSKFIPEDPSSAINLKKIDEKMLDHSILDWLNKFYEDYTKSHDVEITGIYYYLMIFYACSNRLQNKKKSLRDLIEISINDFDAIEECALREYRKIYNNIDNTDCLQKLKNEFILYKNTYSRDNKKIISKKPMSSMLSFMPSIDKKLVKYDKGSPDNLFGCGKLNNSEFQINIGNEKKKNCVKYNSKKAIDHLIKNLSMTKHISCNSILTPLQNRQNCWFNTFFVIFFISDKGRKFFKFFRELMIRGKQSDGTKITPLKLRKAFYLLNLSIEAVIGSNKNYLAKDEISTFDTNTIIEQIYNGLKSKIKTNKFGKLYNINDHGNPINYYHFIINYLGNHSIKMLEINIEKGNLDKSKSKNTIKRKSPMLWDFKNDKFLIKNYHMSLDEIILSKMIDSYRPEKFPDIILLNIWHGKSNITKYDKPLEFTIHTIPPLRKGWEIINKESLQEIDGISNKVKREIADIHELGKLVYYNKKKNVIKLERPIDDKKMDSKLPKAKYKLDSIAKITDNYQHFVGFITCGNKEYYFDGDSYTKLEEFQWKNKINNDQTYRKNKILFNFQKNYGIYLYYRVE